LRLVSTCESIISIDHNPKGFLQPPEEKKENGLENSESLTVAEKHTLFIKGMSDMVEEEDLT
jgi:hypothetical protein